MTGVSRMPRIAGKHQKLEEIRKNSLALSDKVRPCQPFSSELPASKTVEQYIYIILSY
jgi:hypothetical protein